MLYPDIYDDLDFELAFSMVGSMNIGIANTLRQKVGEREFFQMDSGALHVLTHLSQRFVADGYRKDVLRRAANERLFIQQQRVECLYYAHNDFPQRLSVCDDAPVMLFKLGALDLNDIHPLAIVGTRKATAYGIEMVNRIVADLAEKVPGLAIVSGLAYGIDVAAHRAAMAAGVPTIAVMATPLDTIYPAQHRQTAAKIIEEGGAIITQYPTDIKIHKGNFLERNRIVAGICDGTLVVESDDRGGAITTAHIALEYSRSVFAVPGRITDRYSNGCNKLIALRVAQSIRSADDIIRELGWPVRDTAPRQLSLPMVEELSEDKKKLCKLIENNPHFTLNDLSVRMSMPYHHLTDLTMQLEMDGYIVSVPGGRFVMVKQS